MRLVILTSKDHPYANAVLADLVRRGAFKNHELAVFEQDWIIPNKSTFEGLRKYVFASGVKYVFLNVVKIYAFKLARHVARWHHRKDSFSYPFDALPDANVQSKLVLHHLDSEAAFTIIKEEKPDVILSILSKEKIPARIAALAPRGCVNVHPALLPKYRGVSPTFWCLASGERETGVTLHAIDDGFDTGASLLQERIAIEPKMTEHGLYVRGAKKIADLIERYLQSAERSERLSVLTSKAVPSYYSLPTRRGMRDLRRNGHRLFGWKELWKMF